MKQGQCYLQISKNFLGYNNIILKMPRQYYRHWFKITIKPTYRDIVICVYINKKYIIPDIPNWLCLN